MFLTAIKTPPPRAFEFRSLRKTWYSGGKIVLVVVSLSSQDSVPRMQSGW